MYRPSPVRIVGAAVCFAAVMVLLYAAPTYMASYVESMSPQGFKISFAPSSMLLPAALFLAVASALSIALKGLKGLLTILTGLAGVTYVYALFNGGVLVVQVQAAQLLQAQVTATVKLQGIMYAFMAPPAVILVKGVFDTLRQARVS